MRLVLIYESGISQRAAAARSQRLWRWLVRGLTRDCNADGSEGSSCKPQAASLTKKNYRIIKDV